MRIFSINRSFRDGKEVLNNLNVNLSSFDLNVIKSALVSYKPSDPMLMAHCKTLIDFFQPYE